MADNEEEKSEWNEEILVPLDGLKLDGDKKEESDYGNDEILVPLDLESDEEKKYDNGPWVDLRDYKPYNYDSETIKEKFSKVAKSGQHLEPKENLSNCKTICTKCGSKYDSEKYSFCPKDGGKLYFVWKCQHCGEDLTKAQGYSEINICPNCGKALDEQQKEIINIGKRGDANNLKRICISAKCREIHDYEFEYCGKCGSRTMPMQCSCGEIFRQREDGSFDKYCPKCGSLNPVELEKKKIEAAIALKRKQDEERARQEAIRRQKEKEAEENAKRYKIGDRIQFGSYPFYEDGREKPIEWIILDKDSEGNALVISKYCLNAMRFDASSNNWEKSEIRQWLNNDFLNKAFNEKEKGLILKTNTESVKKGIILKSEVKLYDKIYLLSIEEASKYFKSNEERRAYPTPYAKKRWAYTDDDYGGSCWWWLRSPGFIQFSAAYVSLYGFVNAYGTLVAYESGGVRAALKINLNNL